MNNPYIIQMDTLIGIGDAVRTITGESAEIPVRELREKILSVLDNLALPAENVSFSAEKIEPDRMYKSGWNWYADLVSITQEMAGTSKSLNPAQIVAELRRVIFVPQGKADDELLDIGIMESAASAHNPVVAYGQAATKLDILAEPSVTAREVFA